MTEQQWIDELDRLYFERKWAEFAQQYATWYMACDQAQQLMLLRKLRTCWNDSDCMLAVVIAIGLKLDPG